MSERSRAVSSERARLARLAQSFGEGGGGVRVGIGDDAAVLEVGGAGGGAGGGGALVWTVDAQVDGTHFRADWTSWEDVGWRSFMAAASDLAAMGAEPVAALSSLVLADSVDDDALDALARGQAGAAAEVGAPVVGGNLARGGETSVTTTLLGRAASPVLRSGARPGHRVWLAGPVGLAAAGLQALARNVQGARVVAALAAFRRPRARIEDGRALAGAASSAIDVSDGLACDAARLAEASGVRIVLDEDAVLRAGGDDLARAAEALGVSALELALFGGEDYALVATAPSPLRGFACVGEVASGAGLALRSSRGVEPLEPRGFDHFGGDEPTGDPA